MKKEISKLIVRILDRSMQKEADSVCLGLGYQPPMPKSINKFKRKKK